MPEEFINRMKEQMGDEFDSFIKSYEEPCEKSLRVNTLKIQVKDCLNLLGYSDDCKENCAVSWEKAGFYYGKDDTPGKSPLHEAGAYYIQEASAMLPVTLLDADKDNLKVLDLCAAPGGKSTQIASYMKGRGLLVANEIVSQRASILSENIERMGVRNALVISEDPNKLAERFTGFFDRILVDAPCSGEGMFRKHPEAMDEWSPDNVEMCAKRQDMILDCAAIMLAPGGKIVYSTCTFSMAEDEGACERFIKRHHEFEVADKPTRLFPHKERGEGHFAVSFVRSAQKDMNTDPVRKNDTGKILSPDERKLLEAFAEETFLPNSPVWQMINCKSDEYKIVRFGDSIYSAPSLVPETKGLKVMRIGLKLGEFKKNRFEPDHALAMAIAPSDVKNFYSFDVDSAEIAGYLNGMTLTVNPEKSPKTKGWCLVCVNGISLGWGKIAGGIIKNHYPKGLRIQK